VYKRCDFSEQVEWVNDVYVYIYIRLCIKKNIWIIYEKKEKKLTYPWSKWTRKLYTNPRNALGYESHLYINKMKTTTVHITCYTYDGVWLIFFTTIQLRGEIILRCIPFLVHSARNWIPQLKLTWIFWVYERTIR
jgi:hypothetical protein